MANETQVETPIKTLVFGASLNPQRYSNLAVRRLRSVGHEVVAIGGRAGWIDDVRVQVGQQPLQDIHTITLYMGPQRQADHIDYLLGLQAKRIIFNPGTENPIFAEAARQRGTLVEIACTLVLLSTGAFEHIV